MVVVWVGLDRDGDGLAPVLEQVVSGDMSGGNNWQQIACLGALLAELVPILSPAAIGMKRTMEAGSTVKAGISTRLPARHTRRL